MRAIPHWLLFSPKSPARVIGSKGPSYVTSILFTNAICVLVHLFGAEPEGSGALRGYLHGGPFIDFVGEKGPISRWRLIALDFLILLLQIVLLATFLERRALKIGPMAVTARAGSSEGPPRAGQDLDAEEQGIRRSQEHLRPEFGDTVEDQDEAPEGTAQLRQDEHDLDTFYSGQVVVIKIDLKTAIAGAWQQP